MSVRAARTGQKRQLSPGGETETQLKVRYVSGEWRLELHPVRDTNSSRRKPRPRARQVDGALHPSREENLAFSARRLLYTNFKSLKDEIDALQVVRIMKEKGILDEDFYQKFKAIKTRRERVVMFLAELDRLMTESDDTRNLQILPEFIKALKASDQDDLVTLMERTPYSQEFRCTRVDAVDMFRFFHCAKDEIIETVEPRRFIDDVVTIQGIDLQDYEDITKMAERKDRAKELIKKISNAQIPIKVIKPMCACYRDLYLKFKNSEKEETANVNQIGRPVALTFDFPETVAQKETQQPCNPAIELRKLQQRLVDSTNENPEELERLQEEILNEAKVLLSQVSLSCVKFHLRTTSAMSVEDLKECCRNGKAVAWLMSLLKPGDIDRLNDLQATELKLECYIDDEDSKRQLFDEAFKKCLCVLNRDTLKGSLDLIQDDLQGLVLPVIDVLLESKVLDKMLAKSLSNMRANTAEIEMMQVLIKFLQEEELPQTCFCIIEKELVQNRKTSAVEHLHGEVVAVSDPYSEQVKTINTNLKEHTELLEEELDARWFLPSLKSQTEEKYVKIVEVIEKSHSRKSRTKPFVQFLCDEEDIEWFVKELEECSPHVLAVLSHQKSSSEALDFRNAMLSVCDYIVNEVEPVELKSHLRAICVEQLQFEDIEKIDDRRERAIFFMRQLFRAKSLERVHDVMDAFASKYTHIEMVIKDACRNGSLCPQYRCPRIERQQMKMERVIFTSSFTIPGLEEKDMKMPKCQPKNIDIALQNDKELSSEEYLVGNSVKDDTSKSAEQGFDASHDDCSSADKTAAKTLDIPFKCYSELAVSTTCHVSETELVLNSYNTFKKADMSEQKGMINGQESNKGNGNIINAVQSNTKVGENTEISKLEEITMETIPDEIKEEKGTLFPGSATVHSQESPLSKENCLEEIKKEELKGSLELNKGDTCSSIPLETNSTTEVSTMISMNIGHKPLISEAPLALSKMPEYQDAKEQKQSLNCTGDTTVDVKDIYSADVKLTCKDEQLTQLKVRQPHSDTTEETKKASKFIPVEQAGNRLLGSSNSDSKRLADSWNKKSKEYKAHTDVLYKGKGKPDVKYVGPKADTWKYKKRPTLIDYRKTSEFSSFRNSSPVSGSNSTGRQTQFQYFGQPSNYTEYWEEYNRWWDNYWYNQSYHTFWYQPAHPQQNWRKSNVHNRGYTYPPVRNPHCRYDSKYNEQMRWETSRY